MGDLRVPLAPSLSAFGLPATVTRPAPDNTPVSTTGFWLPEMQDQFPVGHELQRLDPRRVFVLPRDETLPTLPRGTIVAAAEYLGGVTKLWKVDGFERETEVDHWRLILVPTL